MPSSSQAELSKTLGRILRYETHKHGLTADPAGWVQLHELMQRCSITHSRDQAPGHRMSVRFASTLLEHCDCVCHLKPVAEPYSEVIDVARTSEGSQGKRFEIDEPAKGLFRIRDQTRNIMELRSLFGSCLVGN